MSVNECPRCSFPVGEDGYCEHCKEVVPPPPRTGGSPRRIFGTPQVGSGLFANVIVVKRYQYEDNWEGKVVSSDEVDKRIHEIFSEVITKRFGVTSLEELDDLYNNDPQARQEISDLYRHVHELIWSALRRSQRVVKVEVEPNPWDKFYEEQSQFTSGIWVKDNIYFGITDSVLAALKMIVSAAALASGDEQVWLKLMKGALSVESAVKLLNVYHDLQGEEALVFNAIHDFMEKSVVNYDESMESSARYGSRPPTLRELQDHLRGQLPPEKVKEALQGLREKKIVARTKNGRWKIRF